MKSIFNILISIFFISNIEINKVFNAELCDTYNHPTYGRGSCVHTERCPNSLYISNYCQSFPNEVKCCFSTPRPDCKTYEHPLYGKGSCVRSLDCRSSNQYALNGYCDGFTSEYTCCFNTTQAQTGTKLKSCGINETKGKGVCVSAPSCPRGDVALGATECSASEVCCYSLQDNTQYYEMRGVWISTVANIDWPSSKLLTTAQQQSSLLAILDVVEKTGLNTVVFQVRPAGDAFYKSNIEPWSAYLTSVQGRAPSPLWDPLEFLIKEAHSRGIDVHAWINPYRARNKGETYTLTSTHMANRYPQYAYTYSGYIWMDPGADVVRQHTVSVVEDIVKNYDVDAIHIDDYFYPYNDGTDFPDSSTYNSYTSSGGTLSKSDWRRENVNKLVRDIYNKIKSTKPLVQFGISPFGIWRPGNPAGIVGLDSFNSIFADSKGWLNNGWLDYLAPQLYWEIDPPAQSFIKLLEWWCQQNTKNKLIYAGTALYKLENNNWPVDEINRQVGITRAYRNISSYGAIHFTMNYLVKNYKGVQTLLGNLYSSPALSPLYKK